VSRRSRGGREPDRVVGGLHPVRELLRARQPLRRILLADTRDASPVVEEIRALARQEGVPIDEAGRDRLDAHAEGLTHQGVLALAPPFRYAQLDETVARAAAAGEPLLLVALDGVTDPHNLGSIARTAEAVGAHGLVVPSRRAVGVTPTAEKAAAGALAHLPVVRAANLVRVLDGVKKDRVWVVGLDGDAPMTIDECGLLDEPLVLVVGAEGRGLAHLTAKTCDQTVRLPMRGAVGSLNASVAAGVALYEVVRRRRG
jgi:23S rRNA (guanosine2251-2'-O)-methyltransferase